MKWPRWLPRWLTPGGVRAIPDPRAGRQGAGNGSGIARSAGRCEFCGRALTVRERRAGFSARVDCSCGHRNHVQSREVRETAGPTVKPVVITRQHEFHSAGQEPDLRLAYRYGVCPHCSFAVRLIDAHVISRADTTGNVESSVYYCPSCHLHDDVRRGRLLGYDKKPIVDVLRYQAPRV